MRHGSFRHRRRMLGSGPIAASRWLVCFGIPTRATPVGQPLTGHPGRVTAVAVGIGSGGRALSASAGSDGTVRVWDPDTGDPVGQRLTGHDVVGGATHADGGPRSTSGARAGRHRPPGCAARRPQLHQRFGWAARPTATRGRGVATYAVRLLTRPSAVTPADRAPPARADAGALPRSCDRCCRCGWVMSPRSTVVR